MSNHTHEIVVALPAGAINTIDDAFLSTVVLGLIEAHSNGKLLSAGWSSDDQESWQPAAVDGELFFARRFSVTLENPIPAHAMSFCLDFQSALLADIETDTAAQEQFLDHVDTLLAHPRFFIGQQLKLPRAGEFSGLWNHAFDFSCEVWSADESGESVTGAMIRQALLRRINHLTDAELLVICGTPFDSYPLEESGENRQVRTATWAA